MDRREKALKEYDEMEVDIILPASSPRLYAVKHKGRNHTVNLYNQTCSCPDHKTRQVKCKHIWRVELEGHGNKPEENSSMVKSKKHDWRPGNFTWF